MRYIGILSFLIILSYLIYPYTRIFQLDNAINSNDTSSLERLIDLDVVRTTYHDSGQSQLYNCFEQQKQLMPNIVSENLTDITNLLTHLSQNTTIDLAWVREHLTYNKQSLLNALSFAFFESPTRFVIRLGDLGQHPIHIRMTLQDWRWRVTGIYQ